MSNNCVVSLRPYFFKFNDNIRYSYYIFNVQSRTMINKDVLAI